MAGKVQNWHFWPHIHNIIHITINIHTDRTKHLTMQHIRGQSNYEQDILFTRTLHIRAQGNYDFEMMQACSVNKLF